MIAGLLAFSLFSNRRPPSPGPATNTALGLQPLVVIGPDGQASIRGVTISNTNVRDAAFRALVASGHDDGILIGRQMPTNSQQISNLTATLNAAITTGLLRPATNQFLLPNAFDFNPVD